MKQKLWQVFPDILTLSRPLFGLMIGIMGIIGGKNNLPIVVFLLMAGWTTDILDGRVARWAKKKWDRPEGWIGKNEIRFDSLMLVGLLAYLGGVHLLPLWLAISYGTLLFFLAVNPQSSYKITFVFESFATIATFLFVVIVAGKPVIGYVGIWGTLLLIYDWRRAMQLAGSLKETLLMIGKGLYRLPKQYYFFLGGLVFLFLLVISFFGPETIQTEALGGVVVAILAAIVYLGWLRERP